MAVDIEEMLVFAVAAEVGTGDFGKGTGDCARGTEGSEVSSQRCKKAVGRAALHVALRFQCSGRLVVRVSPLALRLESGQRRHSAEAAVEDRSKMAAGLLESAALWASAVWVTMSDVAHT